MYRQHRPNSLIHQDAVGESLSLKCFKKKTNLKHGHGEHMKNKNDYEMLHTSRVDHIIVVFCLKISRCLKNV